MDYYSGKSTISYGYGVIRGSLISISLSTVKYGYKVTIITAWNTNIYHTSKANIYFIYKNEAQEYINFIHRMFDETGDFIGEDWRMFNTYKELKGFFKNNFRRKK